MTSLFRSLVPQLSGGLRSGTAFVAAMFAAGLVVQLTQAPPIFGALIASLVVASAAFALDAQDPFDADYTILNQAAAHLVSCLAAMVGLWGVVNVLPAIGTFVCEPLVPWHVSIAIFGAFGMSLLGPAAKSRTPHDRVGLLIQLAFFWIAPFYGFFHAPWFLAQTIALPCDSRPIVQALIVVLGMVVAASAGRRTAIWMLR